MNHFGGWMRTVKTELTLIKSVLQILSDYALYKYVHYCSIKIYQTKKKGIMLLHSTKNNL